MVLSDKSSHKREGSVRKCLLGRCAKIYNFILLLLFCQCLKNVKNRCMPSCQKRRLKNDTSQSNKYPRATLKENKREQTLYAPALFACVDDVTPL